MDLANLFKAFSFKERDVITCFIALFPISYAMLFIFYDNFTAIDIYEQLILASALSVFQVFISAFSLTICNFVNGVEVSSPLFLITPNILVSIFIITYRLNIEDIANAVFLIMAGNAIYFGLLLVNILVKKRKAKHCTEE